MIKRFLLFAGCVLLGMRSYAQSTDPTVPGGTPSNKADAGNVKDGSSSLYNVNMYDGTASVTIPVFNYSIAGLDLGISLSYDTHGVKVDESAGPTGLGWNLSAGGKITRQVNGVEDELTTKEGDNSVCGRLMNTISSTEFMDQQSDVFTASFAGRTIRFIYYRSGHEYKLRTFPAGNVKVFMYLEDLSPAEQRRNFSDNNSNIDKSKDKDLLRFEIQDELNNTFVFRRGTMKFKIPDSTTHGSYPKTSGGPDEWIPETWDLVRVITKYKDTINYTYSYFTDVQYPQYKNEELRINYEPLYNSTGGHDPVGLFVQKNELVKWKGDISYLTKIEYPNGINVLFDYSKARHDLNATNSLDKITIQHSLDGNIKNSYSFKFDYAYFHTPMGSLTNTEASNNISYNSYWNEYKNFGLTDDAATYQMQTGFRLKLRGIQKLGQDNTTTEPYYSFDYNTTALPNRLSPSKDFYGYANGQTSVLTKTNTYPFTFPLRPDLAGLSVNKNTYTNASGSITYGVDKTPNLSYAKAGILEKITNAGGGTIDLFYKDHELRNPPNGIIGSGYGVPNSTTLPTVIPSSDLEGTNANDGLCIDKIVVNDGVNPDNAVTEKYEYEDGQRFYPGGHSSYAYGMDWSNKSIKTREYFNSFVAPMPMVNGSNHGYTYAEVKKYGYNNAFLGSTKYHFTNLMREGVTPARSNLEIFNSSTDPEPANGNTTIFDFDHAAFYAFPPRLLYEHRMGKVLETFSYDQNHTLTEQTTYTYNDYAVTVPAAITLYAATPNFTNCSGASRTYYPFFAAPYLLTNKITTTTTATGNISTSVSYLYDNYFNSFMTRTFDHLNRRTTQLNLYSYNGSGTTYEGQFIPINSGSNFLTPYQFPLGTKLFKTINGSEFCIGGTKQEYTDITLEPIGSINQRYLTRPFKNYVQNSEQPLPLASIPADEEVVNEITRYDSRNNIIEVKYEDKEIYACSIWDTRIGKKIAAVRNAKYNEIAYTSFEGNNFEGYGIADENKGNWNFKPDGVVYKPEMTVNGAMTGKYYYGLNWSNPIDAINPTVSGKKYVLTLWATAMPNVNANTDFYTLTQQMQVGNWKFYTVSFTGNGSPLRVWSNSSLNLDELRLYPTDATMTTTTYEPLFGPSSACDDRGNINYIEYDAMGRQATTRDINRNILSATKTAVGSANDN